MALALQVLPETLAICRLAPNSVLPGWAMAGSFRSISWTDEELSVVCAEALVPQGIRAERGWLGFKIEGPLDFALIGVLLMIAEPLAKAGISLFAISTFDTDYVLVQSERFSEARKVLTESGHCIREACRGNTETRA
jgi:uncharacterized protein